MRIEIFVGSAADRWRLHGCDLDVACRIGFMFVILCLREQRAREDVEHQHGERDQQRAGPGELLPVLVGAQRELEDHHRQVRHRRVHVGAPELVVERGEQQRRGLAGDARDREQHAGDHAGARRAVGDATDHLPVRRAERDGGLAQAVGHQPQHVLGRAHDHRDRR